MKIRLSGLAAFKVQALLDFLEERWSVKANEKLYIKIRNRKNHGRRR